MNRCFDYTHWNPVKHGLVERVQDYPYSSFHRLVKAEIYPLEWGAENPCPDYNASDWECRFGESHAQRRASFHSAHPTALSPDSTLARRSAAETAPR